MLFLRKIFFYLFALIYIILCPLIIMYTFGFIINPGAREAIIKTGLVYLSSVPPGASIYLKDKLSGQNTPTVIQDLLPGEYNIRLLLKAYEVWEHNAPVEANKATVYEHILLIPKEWEQEKLISDVFMDLVPVPDTQFFILKKGHRVGEHFIYDLSEQKILRVVTEDSPFRDARVLQYYIVKESPAFLLYVESKDTRSFLYVDKEGEDFQVEDITDLFTERPLEIKWDPGATKDLFSFQNGYVNQIDVQAKAVYPKYIENVRGYGVFDKEIYVLKENNTFLKMDYDKKGEEILLGDTALGESLFGEKELFRVKPFPNGIILFWGENGELLANHLPYRFVDKEVTGMTFDQPSECVMLWKKDKLGILDFTTGETEGVAFEKGPEFLWLYEGGGNITQGFWVYEASHVLFKDRNEVFLLEVQTHERFHPNRIIKVRENSSVYYSEESAKLYYLDTDGKLSCIEVFLKGKALPVIFPEEEEETKEDKKEKVYRKI